ncbi:hypothetical protein D3C79_1055640 [compost metagenome]
MPLFEYSDSGQAYAQAEPMDIYLCLADRFAMTAKVRAFTDYLRECLGDSWQVQA